MTAEKGMRTTGVAKIPADGSCLHLFVVVAKISLAAANMNCAAMLANE
ncbi:MAG: hypothetical protein H7Y86_02380 [Rhizobacter sp.]|nr:hypothetical protein [Ferruginibacter sp.]